MTPDSVVTLGALALVVGHRADAAVLAVRGAGPLAAVAAREAVGAGAEVRPDADPAVRAPRSAGDWREAKVICNSFVFGLRVFLKTVARRLASLLKADLRKRQNVNGLEMVGERLFPVSV